MQQVGLWAVAELMIQRDARKQRAGCPAGDAIPRLCSGKLTGSKAERVVGKRHTSQDGEGTLDSYQHLRLRQAKAEAEVKGRLRLRLKQAEAEAEAG